VPGSRGELGLFGLINDMCRPWRRDEIETGSATTSVWATCTSVLCDAIVVLGIATLLAV